jgi:hypothetical protein
MPKLKERLPSSGSMVMVGLTLSPRNGARAFSRTRSNGEAICSKMLVASAAANRSFVGVVIRSTWATSTESAPSDRAAAHSSDDLPYRRGAKTTTSWPLRTSSASSAISASRSANASSNANAPKRKGLVGGPCILSRIIPESMQTKPSKPLPLEERRHTFRYYTFKYVDLCIGHSTGI